MKIHWFFWLMCLFMCSCGSVVTIGDNGQLPASDAGADAQAQAEAGDVQQEPEAYVPTLTVSLNPKVQSSYANVNDEFIQMIWLDLLGDEREDVTVTSLSLTRKGVGKDSSIQLGLLDKDYKAFSPQDGNLIKVDPQTHKALFPGVKIKVPAKAKIPIMAIAVFSGLADEEHAVSLADVSDIAVDKGTVQGVFPIQGPAYKLIKGSVYHPQLVYGFQGVPAPVTLKGGEQNGTPLGFEARSIYYKFWFYGWGFDLTALDGGKVRGSKGTFLIKQARIMSAGLYVSDGMFMDQTQTDPGAESMSFRFDLPQLAFPIEIGCATNKLFDVKVDLAATEDEPGEFFGHKYRLDLHLPVSGVDLFIQTFADMLNPGAVEPKASLQGPEITILAP